MKFIKVIDGTEPTKEDLYCLIGVSSLQLATEEELDIWACQELTDIEYELEYQGLYIEDKRRFIHNKIR